MLRQTQAKGIETGAQRYAQEQRRDREERQKKDERRKHHAVRANKYGQACLKPGHSDSWQLDLVQILLKYNVHTILL